jgi:hypothetical protein
LPSWGSMRGLPNFFRFTRSSIRKWLATTTPEPPLLIRGPCVSVQWQMKWYRHRNILLCSQFPPKKRILPDSLRKKNWILQSVPVFLLCVWVNAHV